MSVELYTKTNYIGNQIKLDPGRYINPTNIPAIKSIIINDNVDLTITTPIKSYYWCGPNVINNLDISTINLIAISHSICDPYRDLSAITNKYVIDDNYTLNLAKNKVLSNDEIAAGGYIDFWYAPDNHTTTYKLLHNTYPPKNMYKLDGDFDNNNTDCKIECSNRASYFDKRFCQQTCKSNNYVDQKMATNELLLDKYHYGPNSTNNQQKPNNNNNIMGNNNNSKEYFAINQKYDNYLVSNNSPNYPEYDAIIFGLPNYNGNFLELKEGEYVINKMDFMDTVGSIIINKNVEVTLYGLTDLNATCLKQLIYTDNGIAHLKLIGPVTDTNLTAHVNGYIKYIKIQRINNPKIMENFVGHNNKKNNHAAIIIVLIIVAYCYFR